MTTIVIIKQKLKHLAQLVYLPGAATHSHKHPLLSTGSDGQGVYPPLAMCFLLHQTNLILGTVIGDLGWMLGISPVTYPIIHVFRMHRLYWVR
jgi:hypothetical protein